MFKGTPGPWEARMQDWGDFNVFGGPDDDAVACLDYWKFGSDVSPTELEAQRQICWADAKLIAAAPEMYELLERIISGSVVAFDNGAYNAEWHALKLRIDGEA